MNFQTRSVRWPGFLLFVLLAAVTGCGRQSSPVPPSSRVTSEPNEKVAISASGEFGRALKDELARAHPDQGEWDSEKFHERAKRQLDVLGAWVFEGAEWVFEGAELPSALFAASAALPTLENMAFVKERDALGVSVRRAVGGPNGDPVTPKISTTPEISVTPEIFRAAIQKETAFVKDIHFKMKVFRVATQNAESTVTQALVTASGLRADGDRAQINSEWEVDWKTRGNTAPAISKIVMLRWETVLVAEAGDPWFEDCPGL